MSFNLQVDDKTQEILTYIKDNPHLSSKRIHEGMDTKMGYATVKRSLATLIKEKYITVDGRGRGTKYSLSPSYRLFYPIFMSEYFITEIDEREIQEGYNLNLIEGVLSKVELFTDNELDKLNELQKSFLENINELPKDHYNRELERLAIDLSWKSSQIEGNTYSLLETERLLKDKETASGKPKDDATMLLNHKDAIDFIIENPDYIEPLTVSLIEDIHSILIKELEVGRNIRNRRVGISGTNYKPLDNEYQIREALLSMCNLINQKSNVFEKAFLALILISYIQAFNDGNKRTARIISNALLINNQYCPISYRTINSLDYKMAMVIFYEKNNLKALKDIFIQQYEFAVLTYF